MATQGDIVEFLNKNKGWHTVDGVLQGVGEGTRSNTERKLKQLYRFGFVERREVFNTGAGIGFMFKLKNASLGTLS